MSRAAENDSDEYKHKQTSTDRPQAGVVTVDLQRSKEDRNLFSNKSVAVNQRGKPPEIHRSGMERGWGNAQGCKRTAGAAHADFEKE